MVYHLKIQTYFQMHGPLRLMVLSPPIIPKSWLNLLTENASEGNHDICVGENTYLFTSLSSLLKIWFRCHEYLAIQRCNEMLTMCNDLPRSRDYPMKIHAYLQVWDVSKTLASEKLFDIHF